MWWLSSSRYSPHRILHRAVTYPKTRTKNVKKILRKCHREIKPMRNYFATIRLSLDSKIPKSLSYRVIQHFNIQKFHYFRFCLWFFGRLLIKMEQNFEYLLQHFSDLFHVDFEGTLGPLNSSSSIRSSLRYALNVHHYMLYLR